MKNVLLASFAAIALASGTAMAADMGMPLKAPPPPPPAPSWTGCFIGAGAGYGLYNSDNQREVTSATGAFVVNEGTSGGRGWLGQGQFGCDYQFTMGSLGDWVVGAFGDYDWMDLTGDHVGSPITTGVGSMKENDAWSVGGRVGYLVTPTFLSYLSGGYTQTHYDQVNYSNFGTLLPNGESLAAATYNGWFLGSGFEYAFKFFPGLFLKTEYRYSEYNAKTVPNIFTLTGLPVGTSEVMHPYTQTITTEVVWRFNWWGH